MLLDALGVFLVVFLASTVIFLAGASVSLAHAGAFLSTTGVFLCAAEASFILFSGGLLFFGFHPLFHAAELVASSLSQSLELEPLEVCKMYL